MSTTLIEAEGLTKRYGRFTAVDHLSLHLDEGEVYGFLGPNGSGKSTAILMLLGLTEPSEGWARVGGFDPTHQPLQVKRMVGYLPESVGFYNDLTGRENLRYTASLNSMPRAQAELRIATLLEMVQLSEAAAQLVGQYSRGMRQRLGLADVLLKEPRLIILDDPTLGLDPTGVEWLLRVIRELSSQQGITVFVASHNLHQVQRICDRVGIMSHGRMVVQGSVDELTSMEEGSHNIEMELHGATPELMKALEALPSVQRCGTSGAYVVLESTAEVRSKAVEAVVAHGVELIGLRSRNRSLEDIYLRYFQEE